MTPAPNSILQMQFKKIRVYLGCKTYALNENEFRNKRDKMELVWGVCLLKNKQREKNRQVVVIWIRKKGRD